MGIKIFSDNSIHLDGVNTGLSQLETDIRELMDNLYSNPAMRGMNDEEYRIYLACADNGEGGDITRNGAPLKTYNEWLMS